ncbi:carboxypeptidase-like regulatory domain-containing protein [Winogradskyella jejuensis]|uniref:CarboxypepD_reg-like domain-containing protein n=1 Tax=Winogradskyella jejuensis TaxID=1089305 RepID=A0A1M5LJ57_9FLAO|nr:carboxypeptidase-like regulatory domain-containing protein [Winogradskyella jejuensis]SHG64960.1 CarboxypepD_reg-like domain-containing protein [Winogradskyella jejuensis]
MKSQTLQHKNAFGKLLMSVGLFILVGILFNPLQAQTEPITVKGIVKDINGPLDGVSIYLKGSKAGTVSKANGNFTFPNQLSSGDVLIFSYLGYKKESIVIDKDSTFIELTMTEEAIDVLSAPNTNLPYKSKRRRSN